MDQNTETKLCKRCNAVKPVTEFRLNQPKKKLKDICMDCEREKKRIYYANNKGIFKKAAKKYFNKNKEAILAHKKIYEQENKERIRETSRKFIRIWRIKNPDKVREYEKNTYMNKLKKMLAEEEAKKMKGETE